MSVDIWPNMCAICFEILKKKCKECCESTKKCFLWIHSTFFQNFKTYCTHIWSNINKHLPMYIHITLAKNARSGRCWEVGSDKGRWKGRIGSGSGNVRGWLWPMFETLRPQNLWVQVHLLHPLVMLVMFEPRARSVKPTCMTHFS